MKIVCPYTSNFSLSCSILKDVRHFEGAQRNLLSEGLLHQQGIVCSKGKGHLIMPDGTKIPLHKDHNMWYIITLPGETAPEPTGGVFMSSFVPSIRWLTHLRLGHCSDMYLDKVNPKSLDEIDIRKGTKCTHDCKPCRFSKPTRPNFSKSQKEPPRKSAKLISQLLRRHLPKNGCKFSNKSSPNPPKSSLGASKIEPGALQDAIFTRHLA